MLVFGSGDDDRDYVSSLGCTISGVESADFLLARGPFAVLDDPAADEAEVVAVVARWIFGSLCEMNTYIYVESADAIRSSNPTYLT